MHKLVKQYLQRYNELAFKPFDNWDKEYIFIPVESDLIGWDDDKKGFYVDISDI